MPPAVPINSYQLVVMITFNKLLPYDHKQKIGCLVDDCIIMKFDSGDKLDIAHTIGSLIVTRAVIVKQENTPACLKLNGMPDIL